MESFKATTMNKEFIELKSKEDLAKVYQLIMDNKNFIVEWHEMEVHKSEVIIAELFMPKVRNGQFILKATEQKQ